MYLYGSRLAALLTPALVMLAAAGCSSASTGDAPTASANSAVQNGAPPQMSTGQSDVLRKRYISTIELRNDSAAVAIVKANSAKTQPVVGGDGLTFAEIVTEATVVKTLRGSLTGKTVNIVQLGDSGSDSEAPPPAARPNLPCLPNEGNERRCLRHHRWNGFLRQAWGQVRIDREGARPPLNDSPQHSGGTSGGFDQPISAKIPHL